MLAFGLCTVRFVEVPCSYLCIYIRHQWQQIGWRNSYVFFESGEQADSRAFLPWIPVCYARQSKAYRSCSICWRHYLRVIYETVVCGYCSTPSHAVPVCIHSLLLPQMAIICLGQTYAVLGRVKYSDGLSIARLIPSKEPNHNARLILINGYYTDPATSYPVHLSV